MDEEDAEPFRRRALDTPTALGRLGARERASWADLEAAFVAVEEALRTDASAERVTELLLAVAQARGRWAEASRAKQAFADDAVMHLTIALTTRSPARPKR